MEKTLVNNTVLHNPSDKDSEFFMLALNESFDIPKDQIREALFDLEKLLLETEGHFIGNSEECPLEHTFSDGIYVRKILVPKGTLVTGRIHKHKHPNFLMSGKALVITEEKGREILEAPLTMLSEAGTKRGVYAITDLVWVTIHSNPTNTQDIEELEEMIFADNYSSFDNFIEYQKSPIAKFKKKIIKNLSL